MSITVVNGVGLYSELRGDSGAGIVLVHGSWVDHHNWDAVVPGLARTSRVLVYDRRGHSRSERLPGPGSVEEDAADLAAIITANGLAPAHVAGNSFGATIALKLAVSRPDLFASLTIHEPPLIGLIGDHPALPAVQQRVGTVIETLISGDTEAGARLFIETVALGPGMWEQLPPQMRETCVFNALTWLDENKEPGAFMLDLERIAAFGQPVLITQGDQSPPFFGAVLERLSAAVPQARRHTFRGAGHVPQFTHPEDYVSVVGAFISSVAAARS